MIDYSWNGPTFDVITQSQSNSNISTTTVKRGKSGKMAAGALIGTVLFPGVGTVVGAAIGAGGKSKNSTSGNNFSTGNQVTRRIEQPSIAILKLKHVGSGNIIPITIVCNSDIDAKIKCFQFKPQQTASELSKQNIDMLKQNSMYIAEHTNGMNYIQPMQNANYGNNFANGLNGNMMANNFNNRANNMPNNQAMANQQMPNNMNNNQNNQESGLKTFGKYAAAAAVGAMASSLYHNATAEASSGHHSSSSSTEQPAPTEYIPNETVQPVQDYIDPMYANPVDNIQAYSDQVVPDMNNVVAPEIMNSNVVDNIQAYDENIIPDNMQNNNEIQSSEEMLQENPVDSIQAYDETNTQDDTSNSEDTSADYEEEEYTEEDSFGNFDDEDEDSFF